MFYCIWGGHNYIHGSCTANLYFKGCFCSSKMWQWEQRLLTSQEKSDPVKRGYSVHNWRNAGPFFPRKGFSLHCNLCEEEGRDDDFYYQRVVVNTTRLQSHRAYRVFITSVKRNYHEIMALSLQSQLFLWSGGQGINLLLLRLNHRGGAASIKLRPPLLAIDNQLACKVTWDQCSHKLVTLPSSW